MRRGVAERGLGNVRLLERSADDFEGLEEGAFDLVVLNSVVQYFPDAGYLVRVLQGAIRAAAPGGVVFVGDVRNGRLLDAFHAGVQLHRAAASTSGAALARRVRREVVNDKELVIDPGLFEALTTEHPEITAVDVQPDDDAASLHDRIRAHEHRLLPEAVRLLAAGALSVSGRKVTIA